MVLEPDGLTAVEMVRNLRRIKLKEPDRKFVLACDERLKSVGDVALSDKTRLRKLYRASRDLLRELFDANEKARQTIAMQAMGLSVDSVLAIREQRKESARRSATDFGI